MIRHRYEARPPEIAALLDMLHQREIRYVLVGSVAAQLYGVAIDRPGDLDITPALDRENLERLAAMLREIEAGISGAIGRWETTADGEKTWVEQQLSEAEREAASDTWFPDPDTIASMDFMFLTRYGNFDVVPELGGSYDELMGRAVTMRAYGHEIHVAHIDDLLATLTLPRRKKDIARVRQLRDIQRRRGEQSRAL